MLAAPTGITAEVVAVDCARLNVVGVTNPPITAAPTGTVAREVVPLKNCAVPVGANPALFVLRVRVMVRLVREPTLPEPGMDKLGLVPAVATEKLTEGEALN